MSREVPSSSGAADPICVERLPLCSLPHPALGCFLSQLSEVDSSSFLCPLALLHLASGESQQEIRRSEENESIFISLSLSFLGQLRLAMSQGITFFKAAYPMTLFP